MTKTWLELFDWEFETATNAALCGPRKALHQPTGDGHDRSLVGTLRLKADEAHIIRSLAGTLVAGTASDLETKEFVKFCRSLTEAQLKKRFRRHRRWSPARCFLPFGASPIRFLGRQRTA